MIERLVTMRIFYQIVEEKLKRVEVLIEEVLINLIEKKRGITREEVGVEKIMNTLESLLEVAVVVEVKIIVIVVLEIEVVA